MRAGQLDRVIALQQMVAALDDAGTPTESWTDFATIRAQKVEASTEEYLRGYGETDATVMIFRVRWLDDVNTDMRVVFDGRAFNIRETKELGRRQGLEIRCEQVRT